MTAQPNTPSLSASAQEKLRFSTISSKRRAYARLVPFSVLLVLAIVGPWVVPHNPTLVVGVPSEPPSTTFWFGTDSNGLDVFSRTVAAIRLDVFMALAVAVLATAAAMVLGLFVGLWESERNILGFLARTAGRGIDLLQAIPIMVAGLVLVSFFGRNSVIIVLALAIVLTPFQARLIRTEVLRVRSAGFAAAARMSGESDLRVAFLRILPNAWGAGLANVSAIFGMAIIYSAALGFLGAGIPLPAAEWGSMLSLGAPDAAVGRWWPVFFPAAALAFAVWSASEAVEGISAISRRPAM